MIKDKKFHYVYKITNLNPTDKRRYYYGIRSCNCNPLQDNYWSSSKYLKEHIKINPSNFKKDILIVFTKRVYALKFEIFLHNLYDVANNEQFYNKSKQTSTGFDTTGTKLTQDHKNKISNSFKETLSKNSEILLKMKQNKLGQKNHFFGKSHSEKTKQQISNTLKGRTYTPETIEKFKERSKGSKNNMYGKHHSVKSKKLISQNHADISGSKNPSAKKFKLISPNGEEFIVIGAISKFCKEHNLTYNSKYFNQFINKGRIPFGRNKDWRIFVIDF